MFPKFGSDFAPYRYIVDNTVIYKAYIEVKNEQSGFISSCVKPLPGYKSCRMLSVAFIRARGLFVWFCRKTLSTFCGFRDDAKSGVVKCVSRKQQKGCARVLTHVGEGTKTH